MSDALTPDLLTEIWSRANLQCGLDGDDADALLAHVDHLTAENARLRADVRSLQRGSQRNADAHMVTHRENARLREGIERVRGHVHESWLHQGDVGLIEDALDDCDALLNPTEGETDHE